MDHRGEELYGALEEMSLQVLNEGDTPTFHTVRGNKIYASHVDITACSLDMLNLIEGWTVVDDIVSSDHNSIVFNIKLAKAKGMNVQRTTRQFNTKKANWSQFHVKLNQLKEEIGIDKIEWEKINRKEELDSLVTKHTGIIAEACASVLPKVH